MKRRILPEKHLPKWNTEGYSVFVKDTERLKMRKAYDRLKQKLSLKTQRLNHDALIQALDSAADDYLLASDLFLIARDEAEKFEIYYEIEMSKLITEAQRELEKKKKAKLISSQITSELKRAWIFEHYEKEVNELEKTKRELKIVRLRTENLKDAWKYRMSSIQSQARNVEGQRQIRLGKGE